MVWLTRKPESVRHDASADQSNALLQRQLPTKYNITVATVTLQSCPGKAVAGGCPSATGSGTSPEAVPAPAAVPAPPQPASADGARRSAQRSPKHASKPELGGEDRSSRRPWSSKSEIHPRTWIEARTARQGPKQAWKPEASIEARSTRRSRKNSPRSRNLRFRRYSRL